MNVEGWSRDHVMIRARYSFLCKAVGLGLSRCLEHSAAGKCVAAGGSLCEVPRLEGGATLWHEFCIVCLGLFIVFFKGRDSL